MILIINTSAGINLHSLTSFIIKKIQNLTFGGYRLVFSADNQRFNLYKSGFHKDTKSYNNEYFVEDYESKISVIQDTLDDLLTKNIYFVNFRESYANKLNVVDLEETEDEITNIKEAYENRICDNFIVCGVVSKELIWRIQSEYGDGKIQVLNLVRNPSSAFVYDDLVFYMKPYEANGFRGTNEFLLVNTFNYTHVYNKLTFASFVNTFYNVLDLEENGFYPIKVEHLADTTIKVGRFPVDFSLYFDKINDYVFRTDQNPNYDQLELFNDLFLHFTHCDDYHLCDMFGLLKYKPLSETQLKENL